VGLTCSHIPPLGEVAMLHRVLWVFAACFFTAVVALADDKSPNDAKNLQGTWQAVGLEGNGEKLPDDQVKELQIVIKGDEIFAVRPRGEDPRSKFKLDSSKTPKTIDLSPLADKGKLVAGIYSLKNGQLRLCINIFGQDTAQRPTEFKTQTRDGVVFATLERAKQK
jgi:uncharacterized protein (TIGR03067 family)